MSKKSRPRDDGFAEWGGYMEAKKAKLLDQFKETVSNTTSTTIFKGVAIFVNGYTNPTAEELKALMASHGGVFHHYQCAQTTHIIASNLPNVKVKQLGGVPVVKAEWITESIANANLLDYRKYLLYANQDHKQTLLNFPSVCDTKLSKTLTAADPGFLTEFYNNSRLHLISTLGAEFKQLVGQLRGKSTGEFVGLERLKSLQVSGYVINNEPVVMHIDMDCFFVSVGIRNRPDLVGVPVAVTHAKSAQGPVNRSETFVNEEQAALVDAKASMAEIASCSYEARQCGVRNGMFLGAAIKICPNLKTIPYDFQGYRDVSTILYKTIAQYTLEIEAVSCDEMYVDVAPILHNVGISVEQWANYIRNEIKEVTGCPCSTGFGANRLQARLATRKAKPNGQFHLKPQDVDDFMAEISIADLPGVGYATITKLNALGFKTCADLQSTSLQILQAELGAKTGETILQQSRGIDHKPLNFQHQRKSVSADVNYGIRFTNKLEALNFLQTLSEEVCTRLLDTGMRARCLTLKLLVRAPEAPKETPKFLGCGVCNSINRSTTTGSLISDVATIYKEAKALFERVKVPPDQLRGVGIQLTRLENAPPVHTALSKFLQKNTVAKPAELVPQSKTKEKRVGVEEKKSKKAKLTKESSKGVKSTNTLNKYFNTASVSTTPNRPNIDLSVLNELPHDLRMEILKEYNLEDTQAAVPKANTSCVSSATTKSPFDVFDWDEMKSIIISWFKNDSPPADIDVRLLSDYLKQFAIDRKIEDLKKMVNFLYRHISQLGLCKWHDVYYRIINTIQEGMITQYGSTLLVERKFLCNIHS